MRPGLIAAVLPFMSEEPLWSLSVLSSSSGDTGTRVLSARHRSKVPNPLGSADASAEHAAAAHHPDELRALYCPTWVKRDVSGSPCARLRSKRSNAPLSPSARTTKTARVLGGEHAFGSSSGEG
ncbi:hypothetical protein MRX96_021252 [Rhipicephalus microplus]